MHHFFFFKIFLQIPCTFYQHSKNLCLLRSLFFRPLSLLGSSFESWTKSRQLSFGRSVVCSSKLVTLFNPQKRLRLLLVPMQSRTPEFVEPSTAAPKPLVKSSRLLVCAFKLWPPTFVESRYFAANAISLQITLGGCQGKSHQSNRLKGVKR